MSQATQSLDLTPYTGGNGLPQSHQKGVQQLIETHKVAGIDREHNQQMIVLTDATSDYLYTQYTPKPSYQRGSRPLLERVVDGLASRYPGEAELIEAILVWVEQNVVHAAAIAGPTPADRAPTEERLIETGWGWCNEQGRLVVALAQIAGYPARMCFLFHKSGSNSHATTEIYFKNRWVWCDPTWACFICADPDRPFSARELQNDPDARRICDDQYRRYGIASALRHPRERIPDPASKPEFETKGKPSDYFSNVSFANYIVT